MPAAEARSAATASGPSWKNGSSAKLMSSTITSAPAEARSSMRSGHALSGVAGADAERLTRVGRVQLLIGLGGDGAVARRRAARAGAGREGRQCGRHAQHALD